MITTIVKNSKEVKELDFPKLMKSTDSSLVILFTGTQKGTVLIEDDNWDVGHNSCGWYMLGFTDFKGELTLKNKQ